MWCLSKHGSGADRGHQFRVTGAALESQQLTERRPSHDAVYRETRVALELTQAGTRRVPEDAVDPTRVEAQGAKALLQFCNIVAAEHRDPAVKEAVPEAESRLNQGVPGLLSAGAVNPKAAETLERLDGGTRRRTEDAVGVYRCTRQDRSESMLDIGNRTAAVSDGKWEGYRYAEISSTSLPFGFAPITRT
jgi:hypothetical protein